MCCLQVDTAGHDETSKFYRLKMEDDIYRFEEMDQIKALFWVGALGAAVVDKYFGIPFFCLFLDWWGIILVSASA